MKVLVEVTAEDIERGEHKSLNKCCVGLAVRRALAGVMEIKTLIVEPPVEFTESKTEDTSIITINDVVVFSTTDYHGVRVWKALKKFDEGEPVKPFRFEMEIP